MSHCDVTLPLLEPTGRPSCSCSALNSRPALSPNSHRAQLNTHAVDIYSSAELKSRLSPAEVEYVEGYLRLVSGHVQATVTDRLDPGDDNAHLLGEGDLANMLPALRDAIVFCRMEADAGTVDLGVGIG